MISVTACAFLTASASFLHLALAGLAITSVSVEGTERSLLAECLPHREGNERQEQHDQEHEQDHPKSSSAARTTDGPCERT